MLRHSHGAEGNHLPDHFVDDNTLRIVSPKALDALRCKNAREKKKEYSMCTAAPIREREYRLTSKRLMPR